MMTITQAKLELRAATKVFNKSVSGSDADFAKAKRALGEAQKNLGQAILAGIAKKARKNFVTLMMKKTKKEVFAEYCQACLGRIHSAQISEMRKSWMVSDLAKAYGYK